MISGMFSVVAVTELPETKGKGTDECFIGKQYACRSAGFAITKRFPADQHAAPGCPITVLSIIKEASPSEWAAAVLGVSADAPRGIVRESLKKNGILMFPQIEEMQKRTDDGLRTGLVTGAGRGNFFFAAGKGGEILIVCLHRGGVRWRVFDRDLDYKLPFFAGNCLLVPNLDLKALSP